jgi:uncharacterized SAM-binding protein YcdF (DUF218 family)
LLDRQLFLAVHLATRVRGIFRSRRTVVLLSHISDNLSLVLHLVSTVMFILKKILSNLLLPPALCFELLLAGILLLWFSRRQRLGKVLVTIGALSLTALSYHVVANRLIRPFESAYPPLDPASLARLAPLHAPNDAESIKWVVVLGGGHVTDPKIPITSQLTDSSRTRLIEAILYHRALPGSRLLVSGGAYFDPVPEAVTMAEVARRLGVEESNLVLETTSGDTDDEALLIRDMVGRDRLLLVTSASHMPRAMALFQQRGMDPLPAPVDFEAKELQKLTPAEFFPHAQALFKAERAFYEFLGLVWVRLKGTI